MRLTRRGRQAHARQVRLGAPKVVAVAPRILDAYVGQYAMPNGATMTVTREGRRLMFASSRGQRGKFEVLPLSEAEFIIRNVPRTIVFVKDEQGKVTHYVVSENGMETIRKKIK